jgi:hypothetical protein
MASLSAKGLAKPLTRALYGNINHQDPIGTSLTPHENKYFTPIFLARPSPAFIVSVYPVL